MKATTLLKKLTPAQNFVHFLSVSALIVSFSSLSQGADEFGSGQYSNAPLSDLQFSTNRCDRLNNEAYKLKSDFIKACTAANLGSDRSTCEDQLEECSDPDNTDDPKCIAGAISNKEHREARKESQERGDKIEGLIKDLNADFDDTVNAELEIAKRTADADAKLQETLSEISQGRADSFEREISQMEEIEVKIAEQQNAIAKLQLDLRQFILTKETQCDEKAEAAKQEYILKKKALAANGQKAHMNQGQLFNHTALSVNQAGTIKYNRTIRNCTALFGVKGRPTLFGNQYRLQKDSINTQKETIKFHIRRLAAQRTKVKRERTKTLLRLDALQAAAFAAHSRAVINLKQELQAVSQKKSRIQTNLLTQQTELLLTNTNVSKLLAGEAAKARKVASEDKITAFIDANALLTQLDNAEEKNNNCGARNEIASSIYDGVNAYAEAADRTVASEEVEVTGRNPDGSIGQTARRSED